MIKTTTLTSLMTNPRDFALRYWPAIALLAVLVLAVAGYVAWPRMTSTAATATASATATTGWSTVCVGGVSYLQFTSGASVEWTPAGKVKTCNESGK
jgi:hypothetical protein